jgi:hypothetical protein
MRGLNGPPASCTLSPVRCSISCNCSLHVDLQPNERATGSSDTCADEWVQNDVAMKMIHSNCSRASLFSLVLVSGIMTAILKDLEVSGMLHPTLAAGNTAAIMNVDLKVNKFALWPVLTCWTWPST